MIGQTISRYLIEEKLGEGGMGIVFRAADLRLRRTVALKMIKPELVADVLLRRRLATEAEASSVLNHKGIATLYDFESDDNNSFIVYEYIKGKTLRAIQADRCLDLKELLSTFIDIADGVTAAHASGVIHRDLKPENVMIRDDGQVKILDFGLAKVSAAIRTGTTAATSVTVPGLLLGTVAYMSPEQLEGIDIDHRTDIFSLGTMLYESATGQHPFEGKSHSSTIGNILKEHPREAQWIPGAPPEIERIARKCLRKNREERYQSAREIQVDLEAVRRDMEVGEPRRSSGTVAPPQDDFTLPVKTTGAKLVFLSIQCGYLALYLATLRWGISDTNLASVRRNFDLEDTTNLLIFVVVAAMCGAATRIYLISGVGWGHPDTGRKFLWLFPVLVLFDGLIWGASPLLLWDKLAQNRAEWLSLFAVALLAYVPFAQRTLIRRIYPGVRIRKSGMAIPPSMTR
jgi:serine/threonine protein kinase